MKHQTKGNTCKYTDNIVGGDNCSSCERRVSSSSNIVICLESDVSVKRSITPNKRGIFDVIDTIVELDDKDLVIELLKIISKHTWMGVEACI